jgi:hypothetical protein
LVCVADLANVFDFPLSAKQIGVCAELVRFRAYHGLDFFLVRLGLEAVRGRLIISRVNCCKIFIKKSS